MDKNYWISAKPVDQSDLDAAAIRIIRHAHNQHLLKHSQYREDRNSILDISMHCLADVRGNYFWPEFCREVLRRSSGSVSLLTEDGLTGFCRNVFRNTDRIILSRLNDQGIRNCFVALIFEQAGIGKDRNKIIRIFLEWVIKCRSSSARTGLQQLTVIQISEFKKSMPSDLHHDIDLLEAVLFRIGTELLCLVEAIECHPDRLEMIEWAWADLAGWWRDKTGNELDDLTPSAANVLLDWISRLTFVWTRGDLFRLSRLGILDCEWPDGRRCSSFQRHDQLPLGNALLLRAGTTENICVIEARNNQPLVEGAGREGIGRAGLNVHHEYKWRKGKLYLVLGYVSFGDTQGSDFDLYLAGMSIWQGEMHDGFCKKWKRRFIDLSLMDLKSKDVIRLEMKHNNLLIGTREIKLWPLSDYGFLVSSGKVCKPNMKTVRYVRPEDTASGISLFIRSHHDELVLHNIAEVSRSECVILDEIYTEIRFGANSGKVVSISSGKLNWELQFVTVPIYLYPSDKEIIRNGITFTGSGNICIVENSSKLLIRISNKYKDFLYEGNAGLWLLHDGIECFSKISGVNIRDEGPDLCIDIRQIAVYSGIQPVSGIIEVMPGTSEGKSGQVLRFFITPAHAEVKLTAIEDFSAVSIGFPDGIRQIASTQVVSAKDLAESKQSNCLIFGPDWQLALRWQPVIFDVMVNGLAGRKITYRLPFLSIEDPELPATLRISPIFPDGYQVKLEINGTGLPAISGSDYDCTSEILSSIHSSGNPSVLLSMECGSEKIVWEIDASPAIGCLKIEKASRISNMVQIALSLQVRSLLETEMQIRVKHQGHINESVGKKTQKNQLGTLPEILSFMFCLDNGNQKNFDIDADVFADGNPIFAFHETITAEVEYSDDVSGIKNKVKNLISIYHETKSVDVLPEVFFSYLDLVSSGTSQVNSLAISRKISTGNRPEEETANMLSLKMIDNAYSGSSELIRLPALNGLPKHLALLLASMWLLLCGRYAENGMLDPKDFNEAHGFVRYAGMEHAENDRIFGISVISFVYASSIATRNGFNNAIGDSERCKFDASYSVFETKLADSLRHVCKDLDNFLRGE